MRRAGGGGGGSVRRSGVQVGLLGTGVGVLGEGRWEEYK